ncbi:hypothetical protein PJI16_08240 [Nitrospira sp. MA-1]|nr:hypothetical protein [Nitrospira sp. MA-1]
MWITMKGRRVENKSYSMATFPSAFYIPGTGGGRRDPRKKRSLPYRPGTPESKMIIPPMSENFAVDTPNISPSPVPSFGIRIAPCKKDLYGVFINLTLQEVFHELVSVAKSALTKTSIVNNRFKPITVEMKGFRLEQEGTPGKGCSGKGQAVISLVSGVKRDDEWLTHPHTSWDTL